MPSVNRVILVGHIGADPDTKYLPDGAAVCNFSLATSEKWTDKSSGEKKERTEWSRIAMFGKLAEIAAQYLKKGAAVYIEGKLQTRKWQAKDGSDRYTTEIIADRMQMLSGKGEKAADEQPAPKPRPAQDKATGIASSFDDLNDPPF